MIAKVGQAGGVCEGLDPVIKIIKHGILKYVCILIPVGLILFGLGDLGKAVIASDEKEVKAILRKSLPPYMVPTYIVKSFHRHSQRQLYPPRSHPAPGGTMSADVLQNVSLTA